MGVANLFSYPDSANLNCWHRWVHHRFHPSSDSRIDNHWLCCVNLFLGLVVGETGTQMKLLWIRNLKSFFSRKKYDCYPCHEWEFGRMSCLFCYCPLYDLEDCEGDWSMLGHIKDCSICLVNHVSKWWVLKKLAGNFFKQFRVF